MAKGKPPGKVVRLKQPKVLGDHKELGQALGAINKAAGIKRRKTTSNNPSRVPVNHALRAKLPTAEDLLRDTAPPPLAQGRRTPGIGLLPEALPTAAELLAMGAPEFSSEEGGPGEKIDRTEYLSPPNSLNHERPRAREASYDPDTGTLRVVFRNGGTYAYYQVPHQTWRALKSNQSFGQTLDRLVINTYPFEKVSF